MRDDATSLLTVSPEACKQRVDSNRLRTFFVVIQGKFRSRCGESGSMTLTWAATGKSTTSLCESFSFFDVQIQNRLNSNTKMINKPVRVRRWMNFMTWSTFYDLEKRQNSTQRCTYVVIKAPERRSPWITQCGKRTGSDNFLCNFIPLNHESATYLTRKPRLFSSCNLAVYKINNDVGHLTIIRAIDQRSISFLVKERILRRSENRTREHTSLLIKGRE